MANHTKPDRRNDKSPQPRRDRRRAGPTQSAERMEQEVKRVQRTRAQRQGPLSWINTAFRSIAACSSHAMGSPWAFVLATASVVIWATLGKHYKFSETWKLVINTGTTIVTFLMIFLVQNTQPRDSKAIHLKLDELLRGVKGARTAMVDLENATDEELDALQKQFERLRKTRTIEPEEEHEATDE
jgi:low affinity Fe/Cu permease